MRVQKCLVIFLLAVGSVSLPAQRRSLFQQRNLSSGPRAVDSPQWSFYVAGNKLFYRPGAAPATQPFESIELPANAEKIAADSKQVYVWTKGNDLRAFALGPKGPQQSSTRLAPNDESAMRALNPPLSAVRTASSVRPSSGVTLTPQRLLVTNYYDGSVSAVDTSTNQVIGTIFLNSNAGPIDVAVSPNNTQGFTANNSNVNCSSCQDLGETIFDPSMLTTSGLLTGHFPATVTLSTDGSTLFVGDDLVSSVLLRTYNTATGLPGTTVGLPASPFQSRLSNDGSLLYVVTSDDAYYPTYAPNDEIATINTSTLTPVFTQFPQGSGCAALAVQPGTGQLFVVCNNGLLQQTPEIYVITIAADGTPALINTFFITGSEGIAFSPDGKQLYVTLFNSNNVSVLDPSNGSVLGLIAVGSGPLSIVVNADGTRAYVTNSGTNTISVIDLTSKTTVTSVTVGNGPSAAALTFASPGAGPGSVGATVNGASFAQNSPVAPGSLSSIFGVNIGPATGVLAPTVPLPTTLGNVSVTIGGIAAPLLFAGSQQINVQIPFGLAGQASAPVVVTNTSTSAQTAPVNVSLASSAPGIFTVPINGVSQGAILNQDNSFNTPANPARKGDVVQIFATGQGLVSNQPADGASAPTTGPNSITSLTPIVLIGNQAAVVQFSGLAPGFVGLWQVNANVPAATASGSAIPIQIVMNGMISNTTTLSVQ